MEAGTLTLALRDIPRDPARPAATLAIVFHVVVFGAAVVLSSSAKPRPRELTAIPIRILASAGARTSTPTAPTPLASTPPEPKRVARDVFDPQPPVRSPDKLADPTVPQPAKKAMPAAPPAKAEIGEETVIAPPAEDTAATAFAPAVGGAGGVGFSGHGTGFDENFEFPVYVDRMLALISANWMRPETAAGTTCTVYIRIGRDGRLLEKRLEIPSGVGVYDRAALRAAVNAEPYPPLPAEFDGPSLGVHLEFR